MSKVAILLSTLAALPVPAQTEPVAGQSPEFMVPIERTPERNIKYVLRSVATSNPTGIQSSPGTFGFEGEDAERFREIAIRASEESEQSALSTMQRLCDEQEISKPPELLTEQLLAAAMSEETRWDEAAKEVHESFSTEQVETLIRRAATRTYSGFDMNWEVYFRTQDPDLLMDFMCTQVAPAFPGVQH